MSSGITSVDALEILDSRGRPTVEAVVALADGSVGTASVPSGASRGRHEAFERRDGASTRYAGRGVRDAVSAVRGEIADALIGLEPDQRAVDSTMIDLDGTREKSRLGANAILAVSIATARAAACASGVPLWQQFAESSDEPLLPLPMVNILSGGLHAGRQLDFQDFLAIPVGATTYGAALEMVVSVHVACGEELRARGLSTLRADEGGYGPSLDDHRAALVILDQAVQRAGLRPGTQIAYALDVGASHFHDSDSGVYRLASEDRELDADGMIDYVGQLAEDHPIVSVEDLLAEDDWEAWARATDQLGDRLQLVGDDLFTTNGIRLQRGIRDGCGNAVLVKMNQIGTLSETLDVIAQARAAGYRTVVSARSGETEDTALADLAVGTRAGQIKVGSVTQSERLAKYNQLLRIERALGDHAPMARWPEGAA